MVFLIVNTEDGKIRINWQVFSKPGDVEFADDIYLIILQTTFARKSK